MTIFLDGIAVQFYRGIGPEMQSIAPFSRINFFIGANNAGKSVILNLLASRLHKPPPGKTAVPLAAVEEYRGKITGQFQVAIGCMVENVIKKLSEDKQGLDKTLHRCYSPSNLEQEIRNILVKQSVGDEVWVTWNEDRKVTFLNSIEPEKAKNWSLCWQEVWRFLTGYGGEGSEKHWISGALEALARWATPQLPAIHLIPAKRVLGEKGEAFEDLSGKGLIDHLAALQNPDHDKQGDRGKFQRINHFLQEVTGKPDAKMEVPSSRDHLLVHMDNKVLPLSSFGTGIHEVVLIAAFCTIHDDSIMCIEEPEIHLHTLLQKKLINYLAKNTNSQYFIATHFSALIDTPDAHVFHVWNDGVQTRVCPALTRQGQRDILDHLGVQASDILQANIVIWVEGPSDRTYLNHWIKAVDERLREGIHYSIMFYGGALASHLSASDTALEKFIKLQELNRNIVMLFDSDRDSSRKNPKPYVTRLRDEICKNGGIVWITKGREIENYVNPAKLHEALRTRHPNIYQEQDKVGLYDHAFYFRRKGQKDPIYTNADKVGVANLVCEGEADLSILDLKKRVIELVKKIQKANGMAS